VFIMVKLRLFDRTPPPPQDRPLDSSPNRLKSTTTVTVRRSSKKTKNIKMHRKGMTTEQTLLDWLGTKAPSDVLPIVLAYAGPQVMAALAGSSRSWRGMVMNEAVWRGACEGLYKWSEGDEVPESWFQHYCDNPCVPTDFGSIEAAWAAISKDSLSEDDETNINPRVREQTRSVRILLRPGTHIVRESLVVHAIGEAHVTMEAIQAPSFLNLPPPQESMRTSAPTILPKRGLVRKATSFRQLFSCRSAQGVAEEEELPIENISSPMRAAIFMQTRINDEPIIRVRQGGFSLRHVDLVHSCPGTDIWNGNTAIQVQPPFDMEDHPIEANPPSVPPFAALEHVDIVSNSGRGIVVIDGGNSTIRNCFVHECAATGIYVGGPGSMAIIERTDVVKNGKGNNRLRRGIAPGHSGIYLEQGEATIRNCNISSNTLTGISAISSTNATLLVENSDLVANGTFQLEIPPVGTVSRRRSTMRDNWVANRGLGRSRSGLMEEDSDMLVEEQHPTVEVPTLEPALMHEV